MEGPVQKASVPFAPTPPTDAPPPATQTLFTEKQPEVRLNPPESVEVAVLELKIEPPVMVSPRDDARPALEIPPEKVEVAVEVLRIEPAVTVRPAEEESPAVAIPPLKVEVAVEVISRLPDDLSEPPETVSPPVDPKPAA